MFEKPFSRREVGQFYLKASLQDESLIPREKLDPELEVDLHFRFPDLELTDEKLRELLPPFDESNETAWTVPNLIREELAPAFRNSHSLQSLRERASILKGTAILSVDGFVDSPHELCCALASRYALLAQIDVDKTIATRIFDRKMKFSIDRTQSSLAVTPQEGLGKQFSVELTGDLFHQCFRPSTFLRIHRFDRNRFRLLAHEAVASLDEIREEAAATFQDFLSAYEKAYDKWMFDK